MRKKSFDIIPKLMTKIVTKKVDMLFSSYPGLIYGVLDGWRLRGMVGGGEEGGGREAEKS